MSTGYLFSLGLLLGWVAVGAMLFADGNRGFDLWFWRAVAIANACGSMVCMGLTAWGLMQ